MGWEIRKLNEILIQLSTELIMSKQDLNKIFPVAKGKNLNCFTDFVLLPMPEFCVIVSRVTGPESREGEMMLSETKFHYV